VGGSSGLGAWSLPMLLVPRFYVELVNTITLVMLFSVVSCLDYLSSIRPYYPEFGGSEYRGQICASPRINT